MTAFAGPGSIGPSIVHSRPPAGSASVFVIVSGGAGGVVSAKAQLSSVATSVIVTSNAAEVPVFSTIRLYSSTSPGVARRSSPGAGAPPRSTFLSIVSVGSTVSTSSVAGLLVLSNPPGSGMSVGVPGIWSVSFQ